VVRPDHYVSGVFPLTVREEFADFFAGCLLPQE
jgi:phenol 2-monooxygenase